MGKLWFSIFDRNAYNGPEPYFFPPDQYAFASVIRANYPRIKEELDQYLRQHELQSYFNESMVAKANTWKTISLRTWDVELYEHHRYFPETLKAIRQIPGLVSASFNLLQRQGHIVPHCGDTNGIFRCHLGLHIPGKAPECGFRVGDEWRSWEEGDLLIFTDAHNHEAINNTDENRFIFLFDVVRDEYLPRKRWICSTVLASLFLQKWAESVKLLYRSPLWLQALAAKLLIPLVYMAIPVRNFIMRSKR